jgi:hypothetical protein
MPNLLELLINGRLRTLVQILNHKKELLYMYVSLTLLVCQKPDNSEGFMRKSQLKKRLFTSIFLFLSTLILSPAFAATAQVPMQQTVTRIHVYQGFAVIRFSPGFANNLNCGGSVQNQYAVLDWRENDFIKDMYPSVLAAYLLGKKIGFGLNDNCFGFGGGVPSIYRIDVE